MSPSENNSLPIEDMDEFLQQCLGPDCEILSTKWKNLTGPGENFGSEISAVNVEVLKKNEQEILNLVVKVPPKSDYLQDLFNSPLTFKKELNFYKDLIPILMEIQLENKIDRKDIVNFAPRFLGGRLGIGDPKRFDNQAIIVLENLVSSGYSNQDRILGLDKEHVEFAVRELAKYHAMGVSLKMKKKELFKEMVSSTFMPPDNEVARKCVFDMVKKAHKDLSNLEESKPYLDRVDRTVKYCIEKYGISQEFDHTWATLLHNDFWVNNIMFRYNNENNVVAMKMVDFQLCVYDHGAKDLIFFLISSSRKEVIDDHLDEMIELYYNTFIEYLKLLNVNTKLFVRSRFDDILKYCATLKFGQCIMMAQVIQAARNNSDQEKTVKDDNDNTFWNSDDNIAYKNKLLHIMQTYDRKGWLL